MTSPALPEATVRESKFPLILSIAVVVLLILFYFLIPGVQEFFNEAFNILTSNDKQRIKLWVDSFSWFGPALLILAMVAQMFFLVIPTLMLMVVCVLAYGPIWGSLIAFAAIYSASSVGYFIGRCFGPVLVEKLIGRKAKQKGSDFLISYGFWAIFITRINPFLSNDAVSLVSGILRMGYWKFIGASLAGIAPLIIFIAILGESTQKLQTGLLWCSVISLLIFGVYIFLDNKRKQQTKIGPTERRKSAF